MLNISKLPPDLQQLIWIKYHDGHVLQELKQRMSEFMVEYYGDEEPCWEVQYLYTEELNDNAHSPGFVGCCSTFRFSEDESCCPFFWVNHGRSWEGHY